MESSIATFLMRWSACELLPTITQQKKRASPPNDPPTNPKMRISGPQSSTRSLPFKGGACFKQRPTTEYPCGRGNSAISDA